MEFIGKWCWNLGAYDNKRDILLSVMTLCGIHCIPTRVFEIPGRICEFN